MKQSEAQIQKAILDYGKLKQIPMRRMNVIGTPYHINGKTYFRKSRNIGMADIHAEFMIGGIPVSVWLEVKTNTGILSSHQKEFRDGVTSYGGFYFVVRSIDDVLDVFNKVFDTTFKRNEKVFLDYRARKLRGG